MITHQARRMNSRLSASIVPHSGAGGWAPMPRKPSAAASRMAFEKLSVAWTISGATQLGRMVTNMSRKWPAPATLAPVTYSRLASRHHGGARQAGEMRLEHQRDRQHGVDEARAR